MSTVPLFRQEALAFQQERLRAGALLPAAPPAALLVWLLVAAVLGAGALLGTASYARKETAPGFLLPASGVARVLPPRAGVIVALHVAEGDRVAAGARLATVRVSQANDRGGDVDSSVLQALGRQRDGLAEQIALEQARQAAEDARLRDRIADLGREREALAAELADQQARTEVAAEQVRAVRDIVRQGYVSVVEFKRRQDNWLAQRQNAAALARQMAALDGSIGQQRYALERLPDETSGRVAVLRAAMAEIEAKRAEIEGRRAYLLTAPAEGRVSALQARPGGAADPAVPLLAIVPEGSDLQAHLLVPARAIGFVAPGQRVRLAYDAYPYQRFGLQAGRVETISRNLVRPAEFAGPVAPREASYLVTVALDRQSVRAYGRDVPLGTDMTLKADIVFDRRSLLEWLFDPLLGLRGRWR